jgi:beta-glucosidase
MFQYSNLQSARAPDGGLTVTFQVRNTGAVRGDAVPQVYLGTPQSVPSGVQFAPKSLAAYYHTTIRAGQTRTIVLDVPLRQLQYWSDASGWTTATGQRPLYVGPDERTNALSTTVTIG